MRYYLLRPCVRGARAAPGTLTPLTRPGGERDLGRRGGEAGRLRGLLSRLYMGGGGERRLGGERPRPYPGGDMRLPASLGAHHNNGNKENI
jgi:hypothetical protein